MKISITTSYSQRDIRWRWKKLGYSSLNIGNYGCLLTAYAMAGGLRPDDLNVLLQKNNGFVQNSAILKHDSVAKACGKWKFNGLSKSYNNEKVKEQITKNGFCIVKLTNGLFPEHWVVFIGNKRMIDPWTGTNESTGKYGNTYQKYIDLTVF